MFSHSLDAGLCGSKLWTINIPSSLHELLWKEITGSLPLGVSWYGDMTLGRTCRCGCQMSLDHIWSGCDSYDMSTLLTTLWDFIMCSSPGQPLMITKDPCRWGHSLWHPLLALGTLEKPPCVNKKLAKKLKVSHSEREWVVGSYLWLV